MSLLSRNKRLFQVVNTQRFITGGITLKDEEQLFSLSLFVLERRKKGKIILEWVEAFKGLAF